MSRINKIKLVIVANFCWDLSSDVSRFTNLAQLLTDTGRYEVEIITSDFHHLKKNHRKQKDIPERDFHTTLCHEPGYLSHKGLKRLYSHWQWGKNVVKYIKKQPKPDIIYCAIPSLTAAHDLSRYCKRNNIKFIIDVQDLWPEATFMLVKNKIIRACSYPMTQYIDKAYKEADAIVGVSETYVQRVKQVNKRPVPELAVFLGSNGEQMEMIRRCRKPKNEAFTIGYIGTISYSYDLGCVIDAIKLLNDTKQYGPIKFLVMGEGPLKEQFKKQAGDLGVACEFTGMLPYTEMIERLCACDILANPIVKGAAQSITNKVGDYALAGLPVVNTQECEEYRKLIDNYGCGINCVPGDSKSVAEAMAALIDNPGKRTTMGIAAARLGHDKFDRRTTYPEIVSLIDNL